MTSQFYSSAESIGKPTRAEMRSQGVFYAIPKTSGHFLVYATVADYGKLTVVGGKVK